MATTFGVATDLETILPLIAAQAATAGSWSNTQYSFVTLDIGDIENEGASADTLIAVQNPSFNAKDSWVAGSGNGAMKMEGQVEIVIWDRLDVDEGYRDTAKLTDTTLGILRKFKQLVKVLQLWYPVTANASRLAEPMRLIGFSIGKSKKNGYAKVSSQWSVKFIQDLS